MANELPAPIPESNNQQHPHQESLPNSAYYAALLLKATVAKTAQAIEASQLGDWFHAKSSPCLLVALGPEDRMGIIYNGRDEIESIHILSDKVIHQLSPNSHEAQTIQAVANAKVLELFNETKEVCLKHFQNLDIATLSEPKYNLESIYRHSAKIPTGYTHCVEIAKTAGVTIGLGLLEFSRNEYSYYRTIPECDFQEEFKQQSLRVYEDMEDLRTLASLANDELMRKWLERVTFEHTVSKFVSTEFPDGILDPNFRAEYRNELLLLANRLLKGKPLPILV